MVKYKEFNGAKRFYDGVERVRDESVWWDEQYIDKKVFVTTRTYKKYLQEKRKFEAKERLNCLKNRLSWQMKEYGEVDQIDFMEWVNAVKDYQREYGE